MDAITEMQLCVQQLKQLYTNSLGVLAQECPTTDLVGSGDEAQALATLKALNRLKAGGGGGDGLLIQAAGDTSQYKDPLEIVKKEREQLAKCESLVQSFSTDISNVSRRIQDLIGGSLRAELMVSNEQNDDVDDGNADFDLTDPTRIENIASLVSTITRLDDQIDQELQDLDELDQRIDKAKAEVLSTLHLNEGGEMPGK
ncbi:hypothetical protein MP228_000687 [Amoeboaphelidium protococcarum]|nr:hypothetical protein MP228_000687 [Amoeboaphelidium protococcarum]